MSIDPALLIAIISVTWSAGLFCGLLTARFVQKRECDKHRREVWSRLDTIQDALLGEPINFVLKMTPKKQNSMQED